jgi:hypothetical protein
MGYQDAKKLTHRQLAALSKQEEVSLNILAISLLSQGAGQSIQRKH